MLCYGIHCTAEYVVVKKYMHKRTDGPFYHHDHHDHHSISLLSHFSGNYVLPLQRFQLTLPSFPDFPFPEKKQNFIACFGFAFVCIPKMVLPLHSHFHSSCRQLPGLELRRESWAGKVSFLLYMYMYSDRQENSCDLCARDTYIRWKSKRKGKLFSPFIFHHI